METENNKTYAKTGYKYVAVLSKKIEVWRAMNALGHMTAWMVGNVTDSDTLWIVNYEDKDNSPHYASKHPFIILKAKNSNQIKNLRSEIMTRWLEFSSFTSAMIAWSYEAQMEASKAQWADELEYFGLCFFWKVEEIDDLTKKFSLWI